jgi:hypothetical protein
MNNEPTRTLPDPATPGPPADGASIVVGQTLLGRYEVRRELGAGGTGTVYLCHDDVAGVHVAVKSLPAELAHNPSEMGGILDNFQLVERLHHPAIGALKHLERDETSGRYFLVQEYVEGAGLDRILREAGGRLPWERALGLARQIAAALDFAHSLGIVHRDVKPANIIVGTSDRVKVVDFGIASRVQEALSTVTGVDRLRGAASGTAAYMPPEQWLGKQQGPATDQYALAVTLYQMATGSLPFGRGEDASLRLRVLHDEPVRAAEIPATAWPALARGLAKRPEDRHSTCAIMIGAMAGAEPAVRQRTTAPWKILAPAMAACLLAGVLLWPRLQSRPTAAVAATAAPVAPATVPAVAARPGYHALAIGINDYTAGWEPLANARADAEAVATVLEKRYGFRVRRLMDREADRAGLMKAFDDLASYGPNDSVLVYYAGHGQYDERMDEGFLIPSDGLKATPEKPAKDTWIWNSTVSKILNVSKAKHILLVADSCFSGSLFRGGDVTELGREFQWYKRAFQTPSRFVISSGNLEKVADNAGGGHSPFAHQFLMALEHPATPVFSASDLGNAIKTRVSALTGQHVRMGGLALSANAGGEFVFLADAAREDELKKADPAGATNTTGRAETAGTTNNWANLRNLHELAATGATNAAARLLAQAAAPGSSEAELQRRLLREVDRRQEREARDETARTLSDLNRLIRERAAEKGGATPDIARPRVIAFLPLQLSGGGADLDMTASFYSSALLSAFDAQPGFLVVDRANLEQVLQEQGLRLSALSDQQAGFELGKLLPASLLLSGQLMAREGKQLLSVRLIDTATTRYLGTFTSAPHTLDELGGVLEKLSSDLGGKARRGRPLEAPLREKDETFVAGIGAFHRAAESMRFQVLRPVTGGVMDRPAPLGEAKILNMGDVTSTFAVTWAGGNSPSDTRGLVLRERVDENPENIRKKPAPSDESPVTPPADGQRG